MATTKASAEVRETIDSNIDSPVSPTPHHKWLNWLVLRNLIIIGLAEGLWGYDGALISPLISLPHFVAKYQGPGFDGAYVFSARNLDLLVALPVCGGAIGAFVATPLQRRIGRKRSLLLAYAILSIPGSILQLFAPNLAAFVLGRFWNYLGMGILTNVTTIYQSDLVPAHVRARAVGFTVAGFAASALLATVFVWATAKIDDHRQYVIPLAIQAAVPALLFVLTFFIPESPIWLISKGRIDEARAVLTSLRAENMTLVEAEVTAASDALKTEQDERATRSVWDILRPPHLERTLSSGALYCTSQSSGQILVSTYSTVILVQAGVADPFKITVIIYMAQLIGTVIGPPLVDKVGRRPVALYCFTILFLLDVALGGIACAGLTTNPRRLALASLCIIFFFVDALSFQSLCYLAPTEIPTAALREPAQSWSLIWAYSTAVISSFAAPQITSPDAGNLGAKAFLIFAGFMLLTIIWTYFYYPETASRTLGEIDELYASGLPKRKWKNYRTIGPRVVAPEASEKDANQSEC
ncbi:hypothetical protein CLAIMM_11140 [Cladophialophora immunda]|nr:hypothetical protein CLAIMM_11140 [Cladophialophora immunda]